MRHEHTALDHLPRSARRIMELLKNNGRATTMALARELRVSHEAIRRRLIELVRDGLVKPDCPPGELDARSLGRPSVSYCLTAKGDHFFPKRYDELAMLLLDGAADGAETEPELLEHVTNERRKRLPGPASPRLRDGLRALESVYLESDPYLEVTRAGRDYLIVEKNCPYLNVALERPAICSTTVSLMRSVLGVEVVREERFQDDDGRCVFHVMTDRPVTSARRRRFEYEPPKEAAHTLER